jgi:long-chain acyl-CoA synthetase
VEGSTIGVYDLFRINVQKEPLKRALYTDGFEFNYAELHAYINRVSDGLSKRGVSKSSRVAFLFHNTPAFVALLYALWKLGACAIPLNYRSNTEDLRKQLDVVKGSHVIFEDRYLGVMTALSELEDFAGVTFYSETNCSEQFDSLKNIELSGAEDWDVRVDCAPDDEVLNIFTGGTTGQPKVARHSQQSLFLQFVDCLAASELVKPFDVYLNYAPLFHIGGLSIIINMFSIGATVVLLSQFDQEQMLELIEEQRVTQMFLIPPSIVSRFEDVGQMDTHDVSSLRLLHLGGGASSLEIARQVFRLLPDVRISNAYGMSERAITLINIFTKEDLEQDPSLASSVGYPSALSMIKLLNDNHEPVGQGEAGEAHGKSPCMMLGYRSQEGIQSEEGWFATGDIMKQDECGRYCFLERKKNMIKTGGENVYASEVEAALSSHGSVSECAVVGLADDDYGEIVTAAIVIKQRNTRVSEVDLIDHCRGLISSYKKPQRVFFLDRLPKSPVGKLQREELRRELQVLSKKGETVT